MIAATFHAPPRRSSLELDSLAERFDAALDNPICDICLGLLWTLAAILLCLWAVAP